MPLRDRTGVLRSWPRTAPSYVPPGGIGMATRRAPLSYCRPRWHDRGRKRRRVRLGDRPRRGIGRASAIRARPVASFDRCVLHRAVHEPPLQELRRLYGGGSPAYCPNTRTGLRAGATKRTNNPERGTPGTRRCTLCRPAPGASHPSRQFPSHNPRYPQKCTDGAAQPPGRDDLPSPRPDDAVAQGDGDGPCDGHSDSGEPGWSPSGSWPVISLCGVASGVASNSARNDATEAASTGGAVLPQAARR